MNRGGRRRVWFPIAALAAIGLPLLAGTAAGRRPGEPLPRRHVVEIRGMAFHPAVLEVQPGDTVIWINRDIVPHTATASGKPRWTTGPLAQGQSGRYVVRTRGAERYACELHPTMQGRLVVR